MRQVNKRGNLIKICTICQTRLTPPINVGTTSFKGGNYTCRSCINKKIKLIERQHIVTIYDKQGLPVRLYGDKRPYPLTGTCEVCQHPSFLAYHHWDDTDISLGMWLCHLCHIIAEVHDQKSIKIVKRLKKYINLKKDLL